MKHIYELVLPALAEFGISESFTSAKDRNQQTASKDDRLGDELPSEPEVNVERDGVAHDEKAKGDDEVGGAGHGRLSGFGQSGCGPDEVGASLLARYASESLERDGVVCRHVALALPVVDRLLGDAQC